MRGEGNNEQRSIGKSEVKWRSRRSSRLSTVLREAERLCDKGQHSRDGARGRWNCRAGEGLSRSAGPPTSGAHLHSAHRPAFWRPGCTLCTRAHSQQTLTTLLPAHPAAHLRHEPPLRHSDPPAYPHPPQELDLLPGSPLADRLQGHTWPYVKQVYAGGEHAGEWGLQDPHPQPQRLVGWGLGP